MPYPSLMPRFSPNHRLDAALPVLEVQANHLGLSLEYDESGTHIRDLSVDLDVQEPLAEHLEIRGVMSTQGSTLSVDSLELNVADVALTANGSVHGALKNCIPFLNSNDCPSVQKVWHNGSAWMFYITPSKYKGK